MQHHLNGLSHCGGRPSFDRDGHAQVMDGPAGTLLRQEFVGKEPRQTFMQGIPLSGGSVRGICSVVRQPQDLRKVIPGSILVCPHLSCQYVSANLPIAGIVSQAGKNLATAASILKKYRLPAVAGIDHIVEIAWDGDYIRIDGTIGHLYFIS